MLVRKIGIGTFVEVQKDEMQKIIKDATGINLGSYKKNSFDFKTKGSKDHFKKVVVYPNKQFLKNTFTVNVDGESITYGYCDRIKVKTVGGVSEHVLDPIRNKNLFIKGASKQVPKSQIDLVAYMLLYPDCSNSPYKKGDRYSLNNPSANASSNIKLQREITEWKNRVLNDEPVERLASYLQSEGYRSVHLLEDDEIRMQVVGKLESDIKRFLARYNSSDVNVRADAQKFVDEKYVTFHDFSGRREWRINIGEEKGYPIVDVKRGENEYEALCEEIRVNTRLYDRLKNHYMRENSVTAKTSSNRAPEAKTMPQAEASVPESGSDTIEEKVEQLISGGHIGFVKLTKTVSIYKNGKKVTKADGGDLFESTESAWKTDLVKYAENNPDIFTLLD